MWRIYSGICEERKLDRERAICKDWRRLPNTLPARAPSVFAALFQDKRKHHTNCGAAAHNIQLLNQTLSRGLSARLSTKPEIKGPPSCEETSTGRNIVPVPRSPCNNKNTPQPPQPSRRLCNIAKAVPQTRLLRYSVSGLARHISRIEKPRRLNLEVRI